MKLSLEDLDTLTENRALCNEEGELDLASFERLIRYQLQASAILSFPLLRYSVFASCMHFETHSDYGCLNHLSASPALAAVCNPDPRSRYGEGEP